MTKILYILLAFSLTMTTPTPLDAMKRVLENSPETASAGHSGVPMLWLELHSKLSSEALPREISFLFFDNLMELEQLDIMYADLVTHVQVLRSTFDSFGTNLTNLVGHLQSLSKSYRIEKCCQLLQKCLDEMDIQIDAITGVCARTVLHHAASLGQTQVIQILLNVAGQNAFKLACQLDAQSWRPLHFAVQNSRKEAVILLLSTAPTRKDACHMINLRGKWNATALDCVRSHGATQQDDAIRQILKAYLDENISDEELNTILQ